MAKVTLSGYSAGYFAEAEPRIVAHSECADGDVTKEKVDETRSLDLLCVLSVVGTRDKGMVRVALDIGGRKFSKVVHENVLVSAITLYGYGMIVAAMGMNVGYFVDKIARGTLVGNDDESKVGFYLCNFTIHIQGKPCDECASTGRLTLFTSVEPCVSCAGFGIVDVDSPSDRLDDYLIGIFRE